MLLIFFPLFSFIHPSLHSLLQSYFCEFIIIFVLFQLPISYIPFESSISIFPIILFSLFHSYIHFFIHSFSLLVFNRLYFHPQINNFRPKPLSFTRPLLLFSLFSFLHSFIHHSFSLLVFHLLYFSSQISDLSVFHLSQPPSLLIVICFITRIILTYLIESKKHSTSDDPCTIPSFPQCLPPSFLPLSYLEQ